MTAISWIYMMQDTDGSWLTLDIDETHPGLQRHILDHGPRGSMSAMRAYRAAQLASGRIEGHSRVTDTPYRYVRTDTLTDDERAIVASSREE